MTAGIVESVRSSDEPIVEFAGWWRRGWALGLDTIVLSVAAELPQMTDGSSVSGFADIVFCVFVVCYVVVLTATGGTPGKRMLGMRVVRVDGTQTGIGKALGRELLKPLTVIPLGLGWLWMLDEPMARTWHDLAAGTVVVRDVRARRRPAWSVDAPVHTKPEQPSIPERRLPPPPPPPPPPGTEA